MSIPLLAEEGNTFRSTIHYYSILDIVGSTWFKELYIRDYGGFRFNKMECSKPPEAPSPQVPWPDCRGFSCVLLTNLFLLAAPRVTGYAVDSLNQSVTRG